MKNVTKSRKADLYAYTFVNEEFTPIDLVKVSDSEYTVFIDKYQADTKGWIGTNLPDNFSIKPLDMGVTAGDLMYSKSGKTRGTRYDATRAAAAKGIRFSFVDIPF